MKILKLLGDLFVAAFLILGFVASCSKAHSAPVAPKSYELVFGIYSAAQGHTVDPHSYRDVIHVGGFISDTACVLTGEASQERFVAQRDRRQLSQDLLDYSCQPVFR